MSAITLNFLLALMRAFEEATLPVWIFGGWAEELWQITEKRIHNDIDFLYFAETFESLDRFIGNTSGIQEILSKRFSHKRAILHQQVMIEFLLVQCKDGGYFTNFFSGRYHLEWPRDVFSHHVNILGQAIQIASKRALTVYRQSHGKVEQAYQDFLATS